MIGSELINSYMHDYIHLNIYIYIYIYIYIFKIKMGIRTHSRYDPHLIISQLVNGELREIQDQILFVQRQTK